MQHHTQINARWVAPVVPKDSLYENYSVIICEDKIADIVTTSMACQRYPNATQIELDNHLLIPGLINAHGHSAMSLMRGYADDFELMDWLNNYIWPAENQIVSSTFVEDGSRLAIAEMLLSGTTTFADMYFYPEATAKVVDAVGMRTQLSFPILNFGSNWAPSANYLEKGMQVYDQYKSHPLINVVFGPHAPYTVSDDLFGQIKLMADEINVPIHIHCHETQTEIEQSLQEYGMRPLERLEKLDLLGPLVQAVHMTQITHKDIELLNKYSISVIHCPESNMKLASGHCPVQRLLDAGINVAIGTDGAASNNDLSLLSELRSAAFIGKLKANDSSALNVWQLLEMATINGAKALNMSDEIGSIETGKQADLVAVDMSSLLLQPIYNPLSQLIYNVQSQHIDRVWVAGKCLVQNNSLTTIDTEIIHQKTKHWQAILAKMLSSK